MPDPIPPSTPSWELLKALQTRLAVITTANGYRTNLGGRVLLEPAQLTDDDAAICIIAGEMPIKTEGRLVREGELALTIEISLPAGDSNAQQTAHAGLADVLDALPKNQRVLQLPSGNRGLVIEGRSIQPRDPGATRTVAQVAARAGLIEHTTARETQE
jgi:hypothetical protein